MCGWLRQYHMLCCYLTCYQVLLWTAILYVQTMCQQCVNTTKIFVPLSLFCWVFQHNCTTPQYCTISINLAVTCHSNLCCVKIWAVSCVTESCVGPIHTTASCPAHPPHLFPALLLCIHSLFPFQKMESSYYCWNFCIIIHHSLLCWSVEMGKYVTVTQVCLIDWNGTVYQPRFHPLWSPDTGWNPTTLKQRFHFPYFTSIQLAVIPRNNAFVLSAVHLSAVNKILPGASYVWW